MIAITGMGPRTGTSFVMKSIKDSGQSIAGHREVPGWTSSQNNTDGHWELAPDELMEGLHEGSFAGQVLKIWAPALPFARDLQGIVVLERKDRDAHLASIERSLAIESAEHGVYIRHQPDEILDLHFAAMNNWLAGSPRVRHLHVFTEELDDRIDEIVAFTGGTTWQS